MVDLAACMQSTGGGVADISLHLHGSLTGAHLGLPTTASRVQGARGKKHMFDNRVSAFGLWSAFASFDPDVSGRRETPDRAFAAGGRDVRCSSSGIAAR